MSAAYLVLYEGTSPDPDAFVDYYVGHHCPIIWMWPGIRGVEVHRGDGSGDYLLIARFMFDSMEELQTAITSGQRARARADMAQFPPFEGVVHHQAVEVLETAP